MAHLESHSSVDNHKVVEKSTNYFTNLYTHNGETFRVIETDASNIKSQIINANIGDVSYFGMSGGFFFADNGYKNPPTGGASIHWNKGGRDNHLTNLTGASSSARARRAGTLVTFKEGTITKALIGRAADVAEIIKTYGNIDIQTIIGGASLLLNYSDSEWENIVFGSGGELEGGKGSGSLGPIVDARRAGIGIKRVGDKWKIVMLASVETNGCSLFALRNAFKALGCFEAIFLDGSGSVQYRIREGNGTTTVDSGNKGPILERRKIWNMVRLINTN